MPELRAEDAAVQLYYLSEMDLTGPQGSRDQVAAQNHQKPGDCGYNGQHRLCDVHIGLW